MEKNENYWYGHMGSGFVVCTSSKKYGECSEIAYIYPGREVRFEKSVYDATKDRSFPMPKKWIEDITKFAKTGNSIFTNGGSFEADEYGYLILAPLNEPTLFAVNHCMREVYRLNVETIDGKEYVCCGHTVWKKVDKVEHTWHGEMKTYRAARPDEYEPITQEALDYWKSQGYAIRH